MRKSAIMRTPLIVIILALVACSDADDQEPSLDSVQGGIPADNANQSQLAISIEALRERSEYAVLDKQAVEELAHAAEEHWSDEFSGFTYLRVERFSAGGVSHWMSIWLHGKTGLEFALLPGGKFQMGSPESEADRKEDERQSWVTLDPFLIARTECTQGAWKMGASVAGQVGDLSPGSDQLPISGIGPVDVEIWSRESLLTYPTEAQWEYMCRAGTTTAWAMGKNRNDLIQFGNLGSLECPEDWIEMNGITEPWFDGYGAQPAPAGTFESNAFGLFDVHGNLFEWCRDDYFDYDEVQAKNGTGARPGNSGERLARGGNFGGDATAARSARRITAGPGISPEGGGNHGFGFRPSLDLPL